MQKVLEHLVRLLISLYENFTGNVMTWVRILEEFILRMQFIRYRVFLTVSDLDYSAGSREGQLGWSYGIVICRYSGIVGVLGGRSNGILKSTI